MWMELELISLCAFHPPSAQIPVSLLYVLTARQEHWELVHPFHFSMLHASKTQKAKLHLICSVLDSLAVSLV